MALLFGRARPGGPKRARTLGDPEPGGPRLVSGPASAPSELRPPRLSPETPLELQAGGCSKNCRAVHKIFGPFKDPRAVQKISG
eukprot:9260114-Alexandrium_andersonii.AAC.1